MGRVNCSAVIDPRYKNASPSAHVKLHSITISMLSISAGPDWRDQHFYGVCPTFQAMDPLSPHAAVAPSIASRGNRNNRMAQSLCFPDMQTVLYQSMGRESPVQLHIAPPSPSGGQRKFIFPKVPVAAVVLVSANRRLFSLHAVSDRVELVAPIYVPLRKVTIFTGERENGDVRSVDCGDKRHRPTLVRSDL